MNKRESQSSLSPRPQQGEPKENYTPGGPGPPSSPATPAPASSYKLSSPSPGSFLLVLTHPTLVFFKKTKTASVDFSFQSHLPKGPSDVPTHAPSRFPSTVS